MLTAFKLLYNLVVNTLTGDAVLFLSSSLIRSGFPSYLQVDLSGIRDLCVDSPGPGVGSVAAFAHLASYLLVADTSPPESD